MRSETILSENWRLKSLEPGQAGQELAGRLAAPDEQWLAARMPAQVHDVLLAHGQIPDPHIGRNAAQCAWVADRDWAYLCRFPSPHGAGGPIRLKFEGLDTLAEAFLNGLALGRFENMFRHYVVDVSQALRPPGQENTLLVIFRSVTGYLDRLQQLPEHAGLIGKTQYIRKAGDFGSYLGARPSFIKVGIYADVVLEALDAAWLEDVWVRPVLADDRRSATVHVRAQAGGAGAELCWRLLDPQGREIAHGRTGIRGEAALQIEVANPQLWWPWTHGRPDLYRLEVQLEHAGRTADQRTVALGVRQVTPVLTDPRTGEARFRFDINGQPIFLLGGDWIQVEGMTHCWDPRRACRLLDMAQQARMNVLRVWGGGYMPPGGFYDECDRRGILIWQDFMFGYNMPPAGLPEFDANCRAEITDIVRRLRNHPCILLWCGGNENHMGWNHAHGGMPTIGRELFEGLMPEVVSRLDGGRFYHPSSPFGGPIPNWPLEGDWHDYSTLSFTPGASVPTFASEIGRVSAPGITSMRKFLTAQELWPAGHDASIRQPGQSCWPEMWQYRSVDGSWDKIGPIEEFCEPSSAEDLIRVLGTAHGQYLQRRVERQRRGVPDGQPEAPRRCWGNIVWRLNDCWPILYWSVIDYYLQPKIAYYFLRRAYQPVLVSFERTADAIFVWVTNDSTQPVSGELVLERRRFGGSLKGSLGTPVRLEAGQSRRCLDAAPLGPISLRHEYLLARLGELQATLLLIGERYLRLPAAQLSASAEQGVLHVSTSAFARQVQIVPQADVEGFFEDNFFDLPAKEARTIRILDCPAPRLTVRAVNAPPVEVSL
jgi:beta-mannosidase